MATQPKYYDIGIVPETTNLAERFLSPFSNLNYLLNGFIFDRITLITSGTDNGKSTLCSQILIEAIRSNYNCFAFFGEDGGAEARDRLYRQYLKYDRDNFEYRPYRQNGKDTNCGEFLLRHDKFFEAQRFFQNKLYIFNNNFPADKNGIIDTFEEARTKSGCRVFLLDNVEMFDLDSDNENKGIKEICVALRQYAITKKVHIIIVAHIRKTERNILRPDIFDVKGTSALTNIAKNIITVIRTDKLDRSLKEYKQFAKVIEQNGYDLDDSDSVIEVRKTKGRGLGFVCLKFNKISNSYYECTKKGEKVDEKVEPPKPKLYSQQAMWTEITDDDDLSDIF